MLDIIWLGLFTNMSHPIKADIVLIFCRGCSGQHDQLGKIRQDLKEFVWHSSLHAENQFPGLTGSDLNVSVG